jgi:hypothetical protein
MIVSAARLLHLPGAAILVGTDMVLFSAPKSCVSIIN